MKTYKFDSIMNHLKHLSFSWSSINSCLPERGGCPRKFWFSKNPETKTLGQREGEHLQLGCAIHDYAEERILNVFYDDHPVPDMDKLVGKYKLSETAATDLGFLIRAFERNKPWKGSESPILEMSLSFRDKWETTGWFDKDAMFRGKIDLCQLSGGDLEPTSATIIDWKSGRVKKPATMQLKVYAFLLQTLYPTLSNFTVSTYFIRNDEWFTEELTLEDCQEAKAFIETSMATIKGMKTFEPCPSPFCDYCDFKHMCNAWETLPAETPSQALNVLCQAKAFVTGLNKIVKDELKESDRIESETAFAEMRESETKTVDIPGFVELIGIAEGIDDELECWKKAAEYLKLNTTAKEVKRLLKDEDLKDFIDDITTVKKSSRLYIGKLDRPVIEVEAKEVKQIEEAQPEGPSTDNDLVDLAFETFQFDTFTTNKVAEELGLTIQEAVDIVNVLVKQGKIVNSSGTTFRACKDYLTKPEDREPENLNPGTLPVIEFPKEKLNSLCKKMEIPTEDKNALIFHFTDGRVRSLRGASNPELKQICNYLLLNKREEVEIAIESGKAKLEKVKK